MSLVSYISEPITQDVDYVPFVWGAALALSYIFMNSSEDTDSVGENENTVSQTENISSEEISLDNQILEILHQSSKPMTVKEIIKFLSECKKKEVNSRLYTMYCYKKIYKIQKEGAPLWYV